MASATAAAGGGAKRRRSSALPGSTSRTAGAGVDDAGDGEGADGVFGGAGAVAGADGTLFSNASLHLQAAAAEEAAAAAELAAIPRNAAGEGGGAGEDPRNGVGLQRLQQQEALLRPVAQPRLPAVVTNLSSIWELLSEVQDDVHGELQQLFKSHTWVGMVSSPCY